MKMKKLLALLLCVMMLSSVSMVTTAADNTANYYDISVVQNEESVSYENAPYAGVYTVTSDRAVTVTSELGSTATLAAGETKYIYLIKGRNNLSISNAAATLTFKSLSHNGMDYFDQVNIPVEPITPGDGNQFADGLRKTLQPNQSYEFIFNTDTYGGWNGIVYPYISMSDSNTTRISITTDTGFYAELARAAYQGCWAFADIAGTDFETLYLRKGENNIVITNIGDQPAILDDIYFNSTQAIVENPNLAHLALQTGVAHLNPVLVGDKFSEITLNAKTKVATVSFTNMGTGDDGVVSLILASYNGNQLTQLDITPIDTDKQTVGTTVEYSVDLPEATGTTLKAILLNENLEPKAAFQNAAIEETTTGSLAGKKFSILGDSVSTYEGWSNNTQVNSTMGSNAVEYTGKNHGITSVDQTWWKQVAERTGMEILVNNSYSGDRACVHGIERSLQLHNNEGETPDVIAVFMGINDVRRGCSTALFSSNYGQMIKNITQKYPDAEVYLLNMVYYLYQSEAICSVIESMAKTYGCTYVDVRNKAGFNSYNVTNYMASDETEKLHPNSAGMELIADYVIEVMTQ